MKVAGNGFNPLELAGAFGDLGTLVPFVVGYITINRLDPQGGAELGARQLAEPRRAASWPSCWRSPA
jgi:hypothetical protein